MRDSLIIAGTVIAAIVIGGSLYLFGTPIFHQTTTTSTAGPSGIAFATLAAGTNAAGVDQRANYRITNAADLATLWQMVYSNNGPSIPAVDFDTQEVLAVFDGSHSTGGYGVRISDIEDTGSTRQIHITRTAPADGCPAPATLTSPFQIIAVKKSVFPLAHVDEMITTPCN
ncbi:MAG: protease complex subunit PrcB family protein [Patescibacteria group bacterium]